MQRHLRDVLSIVQGAGGRRVTVAARGKHMEVSFDTEARRARVLVHKGAEASSRELSRIRSAVRRAMEGEQ